MYVGWHIILKWVWRKKSYLHYVTIGIPKTLLRLTKCRKKWDFDSRCWGCFHMHTAVNVETLFIYIYFTFFENWYRPGQTNWEYSMRKFQDFFATQILREINFGHLEAPKKLPFWPFEQLWMLNFWKLLTFSSVIFQKIKIIQIPQNC